jgi:hypothetical protein
MLFQTSMNYPLGVCLHKMSIAYLVLYCSLLKLICTSATLDVEKVLDPEHWMSQLGSVKLLDIPVIPGTHHSGTASDPDSPLEAVVWGFGKCQSMSIIEQLHSGVRLLDIRVTVDSKRRKAWISHRFKTTLDFSSALEIVGSFLKTHPSEGILLLIRIDFDSPQQPDQESVLTEIVQNAGLPMVPVSDDSREDISSYHVRDIAGKVLIITEENTLSSPIPYLLRSVLVYHDIWRESKMDDAKSQIEKFMEDRSEVVESGKLGGIALDGFFPISKQSETSPVLNEWFIENLRTNSDWRVKMGVVLMDFVDPDIIRELVSLNTPLLTKTALKMISPDSLRGSRKQ